jgi:hypothetical protein
MRNAEKRKAYQRLWKKKRRLEGKYRAYHRDYMRAWRARRAGQSQKK